VYSNLVKLRKERGISQQQMADLVGCSLRSYNRNENGHANFKINEMEIIKNHFKLPMDEIFSKYEPIKNAKSEDSK
jgi:putative transcriptional regulator